MTNSTDKGIPLMKPTFFDDNDPNNPKKKIYVELKEFLRQAENSKSDKPPYGNWDIAHECCIDIAKNLTAVDVVKVRYGEWTEKIIPLDWCDDDVDIIFECSACKEDSPFTSKYCPNCGAKMDQKDDKHLTHNNAVILPCKVGDKLFSVKTFKSTNREIIYSFKAPDITWIIENKKEFGKTIFHTYEEVEQILKTGR